VNQLLNQLTFLLSMTMVMVARMRATGLPVCLALMHSHDCCLQQERQHCLWHCSIWHHLDECYQFQACLSLLRFCTAR